MAVLNKDDFFDKLHAKIGTDTSEESLTFLEDMTDTYNDLEKRANGDGEDWKAKYNELDRTWREKYRHRFMNSDGGNPSTSIGKDSEKDEYDPEAVSFENIFK